MNFSLVDSELFNPHPIRIFILNTTIFAIMMPLKTRFCSNIVRIYSYFLNKNQIALAFYSYIFHNKILCLKLALKHSLISVFLKKESSCQIFFQLKQCYYLIDSLDFDELDKKFVKSVTDNLNFTNRFIIRSIREVLL